MQLATGGSAITAIEVLKEAGVAEENILFLNVVSCPEGLRALAEKTPGKLQLRSHFLPQALPENRHCSVCVAQKIVLC